MGSEHISFEVGFFVVQLDRHIVLTTALLDCENWLVGRCYGIPGPRGTSCLLLSCARLEGVGVFFDSAAFQDQANLRENGIWEHERDGVTAFCKVRKGDTIEICRQSI